VFTYKDYPRQWALVQAFLGIVQLERASIGSARRLKNALPYAQRLNSISECFMHLENAISVLNGPSYDKEWGILEIYWVGSCCANTGSIRLTAA
jgi:hypothetical protein